jgi:hypothetical protein
MTRCRSSSNMVAARFGEVIALGFKKVIAK